MSDKKHISDELSSLKSGLPVDNAQPFSVPDGYFDGFASAMLAKVKSNDNSVQTELEELSPLLAGISKAMPYAVPLFYFEQNTQWMPDAAEPDLSFLKSIGKQLPYKTPQGYFDDFPESLTSKVLPAKAKVVPLLARKWMRMAAAAAVGGVVAIAGYQYFSNTSNTAATPPNASQTQVAYTPSLIDQQIKKVSTKDIENFIETVDVNAPKKKETENKTTARAEVKDLVKDVSDSDMESFLSQLPATDEDLGATN